MDHHAAGHDKRQRAVALVKGQIGKRRLHKRSIARQGVGRQDTPKKETHTKRTRARETRMEENGDGGETGAVETLDGAVET